MGFYTVTWSIEIDDATDERDAARQALEIQRDPNSIALVFDVFDEQENFSTMVDLMDEIKE